MRRLHFKTFGVPELFADGQEAVRLRYRKGYALLAYLAVERNRWHERRRLADLFWPNLAPEAARANLRLILKNLADVMAAGGHRCLNVERNRLGLFFDASFDADLLLLEEDNRKALRQCADRAACSRLLAAWHPWLESIAGEFLAGVEADEGGELEDWLRDTRASFERARCALLGDCVLHARRSGAHEEALKAARAWVRCCPTEDAAARAQMELLAALEGPRAALDAYADFARRLESLVCAVPTPDTEKLRQRIAASAGPTTRGGQAAAPPADEVRRVVVLHLEPDWHDEDELLEPERHLAPLGATLDAALLRWGGRRFPVGGIALGAVFGLAEDGEQAPRRALQVALEIACHHARIGLCEGKALIAATARQPIAGSLLPALAQRLAMCGEPGEVIVTATLAGELHALAGFAPLPRRRFAGVAGEHTPCRVVAAGADDPALAAFATPFIGRWQELLRLTETMGAVARKGSTLFVAVVGLPGTGKSRLLAEFARLHAHAGGIVRWIKHRPELRHVALGALRPEDADMENLAGRGLIDAMIAKLFAPSGSGWPALLIFDDLHWADEATRELLAIAMQAPAPTPVLAVLVCRPETGMEPVGGVILPQVILPPLSLPESMALIASLDPDGHVDEARRAQLARMSGGLPLCAEYLARGAHDQTVSDASLFGVLQSVLDRMGPDKTIIQAASVLGASFHGDGLRSLLPGRDIAAALKLAVTLAIVERTGEDSLAFRHALLRDCAYQSAPPQTRRDWHRKAAQWLTLQPGAAPADIAQHYEAAQAWPEACTHWRQAAETAYLEEFASEAKEAALRALAAAAKHGRCGAAERAELELLAGYATLMTDGYGAKGAQKFFAPLVAHASEELPQETRFRALCGMAAAFPQGRNEGLETMRRIENMACLPVQRMMANYGYASILHWRGEFAAALQRIEEVIKIGATIPAHEWLPYSADNPVIACRALKAVVLAYSGTAEEAIATAEEAVSEARREGRVHGLCFALTLAASVHLILNRPEDTERFAAEGRALATRHRFQFWQAYNALFDLWVQARQGRFALRQSFKLISLHREIAAASRLSPVTSWWFVACICEALERWSLLDAVAARALTLAKNGGDTHCMPDLMRQRALARHARGDAPGARRWLQDAYALLETQGSLGLIPRLARVGERIGVPASIPLPVTR
ncbi:MAG TPA: AAA family ATPase [Rhodocyclaceae bacterium]|nr:AAA family ATPase [Rhodocyclaceae bacterium]